MSLLQMPRKDRVEYEGALYHVMDRGNRLETIFYDDRDCGVFLKTLGEASTRQADRNRNRKERTPFSLFTSSSTFRRVSRSM